MANISKMETAKDDKPALDDDISYILKGIMSIFENYPKNLENVREKENQINLMRNELTKSQHVQKEHWVSLDASRKLIVEQQRIISKLIGAKEEVKFCKDELQVKEDQIQELKKEKETLLQSIQVEKHKMMNEFEENAQLLNLNNDYEMKRLKNETEAVKCMAECKVQEITSDMNKMKKENSERIKAIILDYEEQLSESHKQQIQIINDKTDIITGLKKRISELESKQIQAPKNNYNGNEESKSSNMSGRSSSVNLKQNAPYGPYKLSSKSKSPLYPPLKFQTKEHSRTMCNNDFNTEPTKNLVKPAKRKLLNKDLEFYDENAQ